MKARKLPNRRGYYGHEDTENLIVKYGPGYISPVNGFTDPFVAIEKRMKELNAVQNPVPTPLLLTAGPRKTSRFKRPAIFCGSLLAVVLIGLLSWFSLPHEGPPHLRDNTKAQVFPIPMQVGGNQSLADKWTHSNGPLPTRKPLLATSGSYSVSGKPSLSVDFMNRVLAYYHSPAAGKAQALYDDGLKYGLDPAYALAFFMHESTFGTAGVARATRSLSNMRCVPEYRCVNGQGNDCEACRQGGGYSAFASWEDGFEAWFKLIRNLYIAEWSLVTVDQIIPVYAPSGDNNAPKEYIASLKHTIDTWHAGIIPVT